MTTYFISDLHLSPKTPAILQNFHYFLEKIASKADALYILGDFFDAWVGDDDNSEFNRNLVAALSAYSKYTPLYFMHGNRDFLIGTKFCSAAGCTLLEDPCLIKLYGQDVLLMHGDTLCTDDIDYQNARKKLRDKNFQASLLKKPLWLRKAIACFFRLKSQRHIKRAPLTIMDVNLDAVQATMKQYQITQLIHGHTHRPGMHASINNDSYNERMVLSDWDSQGHYLAYHPNGKKELAFFTAK